MQGFTIYLKKPDCDCEEDDRVKKRARIILWVGTALFLFALTFQRILVWIYA